MHLWRDKLLITTIALKIEIWKTIEAKIGLIETHLQVEPQLSLK